MQEPSELFQYLDSSSSANVYHHESMATKSTIRKSSYFRNVEPVHCLSI